MPDNLQPPYQVSYSRVLLKKLAYWGAEAIEFGVRRQLLEALLKMQSGLVSDPLAWGDPQYQFPHLKLLKCHRLLPPLYVIFSVDVDGRKVYVHEIKLYSNLPFTENPGV